LASWCLGGSISFFTILFVNFFGHAAVASWVSPQPGVALGAMIPDFSTMSGARVEQTSDELVAAGIELHHKTDAAFHTLPVVTGLMRELDDRLDARKCARGPRRAVAHIGVELLLDGVLVDEPSYRAAYLAGIAHDAPIEWREPDDDRRFAALIARLRGYGLPDDLKRTESIAMRLQRMLSHRPLLAPSASDMDAIRSALVEYQSRVIAATDAVMRALRAALPPSE
jgi:acyl carrier protein phosphodiesterase